MTPARIRIREAARRLEGVAEDPLREAAILLALALGLGSRAELHTKNPSIDANAGARFDALVTARARGVPVAYLRGHAEFRSHTFLVGPGVLIPRPDTERLVEAALEVVPERSEARIVDLGTGSGAVALSLLLDRPHARAVATDVSRVALDFASRNARALGVRDRVRFVRSVWVEAFRAAPWATLVVSNPPYVGEAERLPADITEHEPRRALRASEDGLADIRRLVAGVPPLLPSGGRFLFEIGSTQWAPVRALVATSTSWTDADVLTDAAGRDRVVSLVKR